MILLISIAMWIAVLSFAATAVGRVLASRGRDHDAMSFAFALTALVMLGFSGRWFIAPDSVLALNIMRLFGCALALFLIILIRFYKKWG